METFHGWRGAQVSTEIGASCTCLIWKLPGYTSTTLRFAPVYKRYVVHRCREKRQPGVGGPREKARIGKKRLQQQRWTWLCRAASSFRSVANQRIRRCSPLDGCPLVHLKRKPSVSRRFILCTRVFLLIRATDG